ncbi:hypothetical protein FXO37_30622 [Capsicum annuum]|nr:hypothetical protein FXO37_30622 [Capsicum annuum]
MKGVAVLLPARVALLAGARRHQMQTWSTRSAHVESTVGAIPAHVQRVKAAQPLLARPTASAVLPAPVPPVPLS